ncbi:MAG: hypothetical protein IJ460_00990 [Clostridia bacterium]|nr:hypothetical protein [Clostridia bacterium]
MKKLISMVIAFVMCMCTFNVFADGTDLAMQDALVAVKDKIDIPAEAKNFESGSYTTEAGTYYNFYWSDDDHNISVNVDCDSLGRISSYNSYENSKNESPKLIRVTKEQIFEQADSFIRKALPELFENSGDCLVYNEAKSSGRLNHSNTRYTFVYGRMYNGIPVLSNTATVSAVVRGDKVQISNLYCSWYYNAEFDTASDLEGDVSAKYFEQYPLEMIYQKQYSYMPIAKSKQEDTAVLLYRFKDGEMGYVSASTGEKIAADSVNDYGVTMEASADMAAGAANSKSTSRLTEAELREIDEISGLVSQEEAEKMLKEYKELNIGSLKTQSFSVNKSENKYYINVNMIADKEESSHYFYASLDGKTGEILNINNHIYNSKGAIPADGDYADAVKIADAFVQKAASGKIKECVAEDQGEKSFTVRYTRLVNGVKYTDNSISAVANAVDKYITSYSLSWDDDVSAFVSPDKAISAEVAYEAVRNTAPIKAVYVLSGGKFVKCVAPSADEEIRLDALTGELIRRNKGSVSKQEYTDISGHWAEVMVKALADVGIGLDSEELHPDMAICQADFLRLMLCAFRSSTVYRSCDADELYENVSDIISEEERNDDAEVKREDAFYYMIKFMGYDKIAEMDIFRSDFADSTDLSGNRLGSAALLTGFGVVNGDDGELRAGDSITNAETVALIYNYLTKN